MTTPFLIREQSFAEEIEPGVQTLMQALQFRQQLGLQRQQLELERQRTQAQVEQAGAQTAETRANTKRILTELEDKDLQLQATDFAARSVIGAASAPGGLSPENLASAREEIIRKGDKKIASRALLAFDAIIKEREEAARLTAERRQEETAAKVGEATTEEQIAVGQMAPEIAAAQLQAEQARVLDMRQRTQIDRMTQAQNAWEAGQSSWGEVRQLFGVPAGLRPDDAVFQLPTAAGGAGSVEARKAANYAIQMAASHATINAIVDETGGATIPATLIGRRFGGPLVEVFANRWALSPEMQQLVQAQRVFSDAFRYFVSGQQTSDKEFDINFSKTVELAGDGPAVKAQKRIMREMMIEAAQQLSSGSVNPELVVDDMLRRARREKMPAFFLKNLEKEKERARDLNRFAETNDISLEEAREIRFREQQLRGLAPIRDSSRMPSTPDTIGSDSAWAKNMIDGLIPEVR